MEGSEAQGREGEAEKAQERGTSKSGTTTESARNATQGTRESVTARTNPPRGRHSTPAAAAPLKNLLLAMLRHSSQRLITRPGFELYWHTRLQCTLLGGSASGTHFGKREYCSRMGGGKDLGVVQGVDLTRYQGRWYEIASIPTRFQPAKGTNSRATYALKEDQTVDVLNETWVKGKRSYIHGKAWKADPASPDAKLKVRFMVPPFLPVIPATGDYWVMKLDQNYQWALVGVPSRADLWVLCRTQEMSEETYKELVEYAANEGYDVSKLHKTEQVPGVGEGDGENTDRHGAWWVKSLFKK